MVWLLCSIAVMLGVLGVLLYLRWRLKNSKSIALAARLPGPKAIPLLGNAAQVAVKEAAFINVIGNWITEYGDLIRVWMGPDLNIIASNPDHIRVLLSSPKTSVKGKNYKFMAEMLGGGILSGSGPVWRRDRKLALPNYGKRAVEAYTEVFNREADLMVEELKTLPSEQFDIYKQIVQCTTYSVCHTLMGVTRDKAVNLPYLKHLVDETPRIYDLVFERMTHWFLHLYPVFWLSGKSTKQKSYVKQIAAFADAIVGVRRSKLQDLSDDKNESLLKTDDDSMENTQLSVVDRFLLSKQLDTFELRNEIFTIFTSSQEAAAKIASFLVLMLAYHPVCQEKLVAEIKRVVGLEPSPISDEDLRSMPYLDMVFKEILRLFPIGGMIQRDVVEDFELTKDITLPAGSAFIIPIFHIHRDPRFWLNPNDFDPERFTPENTRLRHPFCYLPFSLGQMACLGRHFCAKLVKTMCIKLLREFHVSSSESYKELKLKIAISVTSVKRFHVTLAPRQSKHAVNN